MNEVIKFESARIYQNDNLILKDIHLSIYENEFIYFVGRVGSGRLH
jgi:ABC-type ATPase involved in cell division